MSYYIRTCAHIRTTLKFGHEYFYCLYLYGDLYELKNNGKCCIKFERVKLHTVGVFRPLPLQESTKKRSKAVREIVGLFNIWKYNLTFNTIIDISEAIF